MLHKARPGQVCESDNPGGGAPCDGTVMLDELVRANVPSAVVAIIADPEAVAQAHKAGAGRRATLTVGGKTDKRHGPPLTLTGEVRWAGEKTYVNKGAMMTGMRVTWAAVFRSIGRSSPGKQVPAADCEACAAWNRARTAADRPEHALPR